MKGYKVFNSDFTCRDFQYEVGKTYEIDGDIGLCEKGFHFCLVASDCFNYYSFNSSNKVAEIEASDIEGETIHGDYKSATKKITILREISWQEVLTIISTGKYNTGLCNTGNWNTGYMNTGNSNTGYWNTGYWNTGNSNTGNWNTGYSNTGDSNTGYMNTGDSNTGYWNTGDSNTGDCNTGYMNTGDSNTGNSNTGYWNTGYWNTGNRNTGYWNTGYWNTGDSNTGDWNTGDMNTGNRNTGDWNTTNFSNGVFCTEEPKILIFDTQSELTLKDWRDTEAYWILNRIQTVFWVGTSEMTNQEKELHPEHETTGGFLKTVHIVEASEKWWNKLTDREKQIIKDIPNFDSEKFYNIVGIRV